MARADAARLTLSHTPLILYACHQIILNYAPSNVWKLSMSQTWWYPMNKEARTGADGMRRCSTILLLRMRSNIICVAAKSFEICAFVHACTGDGIQAKSRICPHTSRKRRHIKRCNIWYAPYEHVAARAHNYTMIARPQPWFCTPKHHRPTPLWCPQQAGQQYHA